MSGVYLYVYISKTYYVYDYIRAKKIVNVINYIRRYIRKVRLLLRYNFIKFECIKNILLTSPTQIVHRCAHVEDARNDIIVAGKLYGLERKLLHNTPKY